MYQLTNGTSILRTSDGASIPNDPNNTDYANYLAWVAAGNNPDPIPSVTTDQLASSIRSQRNSYLDQLQPLYVRHKSQLDLGGTTSLTSAQFTDLLTLMEALRNVPEQAGFPSTCVWPTVPAWLTLPGA